ncbi:MAG TPA: hypothetical protein VEX62_01650 [Candidatus Limnocylindrales bacterium]|nr:hypothetical protein [Candidatus Limnocylindrales bacterium]
MLRRLRWLVIPSLLVVAACTASLPAPSLLTPSALPSSPATTSPSESVAPPPTGSASPAIEFYDDGYLSFEYPAEWPIIATRVFNGVAFTPIVLGTGEWDDGCEPFGSNGIHCSGSELIADPGELVAEFWTQGHGPASLVYELPSFESYMIEGGAAVDRSTGPTFTNATVFPPGRLPYEMRVRYGSPMTEAERETIEMIIGSVRFGSDDRQFSLSSWDSTSLGSRACTRTVLRGQIGRGDFPSLNLGGTAYAALSWPRSWTSRLPEGGRVEILDESGDVVAREWDEVEIGGRGDANEFKVCADAVRVVRAFP